MGKSNMQKEIEEKREKEGQERKCKMERKR